MAKQNQWDMKEVLQALHARIHPSLEDLLELQQSLS